MKTKVLFLLSGTFALLLATSPIIPVFNQTVLAETTQSVHGEGKFAKLNLTDEQKAQMKKIHESTRQQMDKVFTPEQKVQWEAARKDHQKPNLNLSQEQKEQIKAIRKDAKAQIEAILTPAQQKEFEAMKSTRYQKP
jgi:Spy/CpxP family protein refolding chaperone